MYTELQIDMLQADTITALERKVITTKQFENRIKRLNKIKEDLEEMQQEFIGEMAEKDREVQQDMSRGGL